MIKKIKDFLLNVIRKKVYTINGGFLGEGMLVGISRYNKPSNLYTNKKIYYVKHSNGNITGYEKIYYTKLEQLEAYCHEFLWRQQGGEFLKKQRKEEIERIAKKVFEEQKEVIGDTNN